VYNRFEVYHVRLVSRKSRELAIPHESQYSSARQLCCTKSLESNSSVSSHVLDFSGNSSVTVGALSNFSKDTDNFSIMD
jgi:hypothetical protein